jgi:hypothetical protein
MFKNQPCNEQLTEKIITSSAIKAYIKERKAVKRSWEVS